MIYTANDAFLSKTTIYVSDALDEWLRRRRGPFIDAATANVPDYMEKEGATYRILSDHVFLRKVLQEVPFGSEPDVTMFVAEQGLSDGLWHICYNASMEHLTESTILDKMLKPVARCWTPSVAQQIAALRADPLTQAHIDELATKCNEGELTEAEQREYEAYVEALDLIGLLQAKARAILARLPQC